MIGRDFCFWLQGLFELADPKTLTEAQTEAVKRHLALVFIHEIDPSAGGPDEQAKLNAAHQPAQEKVKASVGPQGAFRC